MIRTIALAAGFITVAMGCDSPETGSSARTDQADTEIVSDEPAAGSEHPAGLADFSSLFDRDRRVVSAVLANIDANWHPGHTIMLVETLRFLQDQFAGLDVQGLLHKRTGQAFERNFGEWHQWIWKQKYEPHPNYAAIKGQLYAIVDPRFREYFADERPATIRLDEIRWGGVRRDGIPPLKDPEMITATEANYLEDSNVVFGIKINGDARAYPKRILAWHEMVKDTIGGESLNGVYCTLCGSMVVYFTEVDGVHHELGTSGFLYRSNKLMYDHGTKSLWSTLTGEPVVGPLVGQEIVLERRSVVTTTWGEWRRRHPETKVLSLNTGHRRDYGEGVAYREYFTTDKLMFGVPSLDNRLANKAEVLALRFDDSTDEPLAISAEYLANQPVYYDKIGSREFVVLTDATGANRVYESQSGEFQSWDGLDIVVDQEGTEWKLTETTLTAPSGDSRKRLPAHRAFWFGWQAAYPNTRLVK